MQSQTKAYLGDGVYVDIGSFKGEWVLTTEDGISAQNRIVVDDVILAALEDYRSQVVRMWEEENAEG